MSILRKLQQSASQRTKEALSLIRSIPSLTVYRYPELFDDLGKVKGCVPAPKRSGWQVYTTNAGWMLGDISTVGNIVCLDFETTQKEQVWMPTCVALFDLTKQAWWWLWCDEGQDLVYFPDGRVIVGQNVVAHDRRYLSCAYNVNDTSIYIDTMQLATIIGGLHPTSGKNTAQELWDTFDRRHQNGEAVPGWYDRCHRLSLKFLSERYLGVKMDKSIRDKLWDDPTSVSPESLQEYCMGDVLQTALLAQRLIKIVDEQFVLSPVTWAAMIEENRPIYCPPPIKLIEEIASDRRAMLSEWLGKLLAEAHENKEAYPFSDKDWQVITKGQHKGKQRLLIEYPLEVLFAILLQLRWQGQPITYKKAAQGQPRWFVGDQPLADWNRDGAAKNPLGVEWRGFVGSGVLTSPHATPLQLDVFILNLDGIEASHQILEGRKAIYELNGVSVSDHNPIATQSREPRSQFKMEWLLGYSKMPGYTMQEVELPITTSVYREGDGLQQLAEKIVQFTGKPIDQAQTKAAQIDPEQDPAYVWARRQAETKDARSPLSTLIPNSLNPAYLPTQRSFLDMRIEWAFRSAATDYTHLLMAAIAGRAQKTGVSEQIRFAYRIRGTLIYWVKEGYVEDFIAIQEVARMAAKAALLEACPEFEAAVDD